MSNIKFLFFSLLIMFAFFKVIIYPINEFFILPSYMDYKSKNIKNIKKGHACYKGKYNTKNGGYVYEYYIDGTLMTSISGIKVRFPYFVKRGVFFDRLEANSGKCISISYVEVNYFFTKKRYIYDFI